MFLIRKLKKNYKINSQNYGRYININTNEYLLISHSNVCIYMNTSQLVQIYHFLRCLVGI